MECGQNPQTIWQALASALVKDNDGKVYLNLALLQSDCSVLAPYIDCNNNHIDPSNLLMQVVGVDDCLQPVINAIIPLVNLDDLADIEVTPTDGSALKYDTETQTWGTRIEWDDLRITPGSFDRPGISDPGTDDTWATNSGGNLPILLEVDFHVPMDTQGSSTHSSK